MRLGTIAASSGSDTAEVWQVPAIHRTRNGKILARWQLTRKSENHSTKERSSTELRFASFPARL
jgi:hypothetical protein